MSSRASGSDSGHFDQLDERIRRWIWNEGWTELRDAQARAIPALLDADRDVIIAAATAAGKTEAAFLPILTNLLRDDPCAATVLYISPLKALINDQWERLADLCDRLDIPVVGWHGDVSSSRKRKFFERPAGVLIITPESLEAMFVTRGTAMANTFASLRYIVVDELHALIGSERGMQLQSLMHRAELASGHRVARVGLSATLGDMQLAAHFLRPRADAPVEIIESHSSGQELRLLVKGFVEKPSRTDIEADIAGTQLEDAVSGDTLDIANHLYGVLRGSNNLIFPNSRRAVEIYADLLRRACERDGYPNEFYPHHGSLSKELRDDAERALKAGDKPASAICTTTLELGIDLGAVKSVAQIGPPPSVASLRQRMGRSGRRAGEPAIVRVYCVERTLTSDADFSDRIRESLVQSVAMINLMLRRWVEPPRATGTHTSTLVQQILSLIAERGGCTAATLYDILIASGPFGTIDKPMFLSVLRGLGAADLIVQDRSGLLLHGERGAKLVNHYEFYAAFNSADAYKIVDGGRTLGTLPIVHAISPGQSIVFAGRRWIANEVDQRSRTVYVTSDAGGAPPVFDGSGAMVHDEVRHEMKRVLEDTAPVAFLDAAAQKFLGEAREYFASVKLGKTAMLRNGTRVILVTWRGDWVNDALALLLRTEGLSASNRGLTVEVTSTRVQAVTEALRKIAGDGVPAAARALAGIDAVDREKWDWALPDDVKRAAYASLNLDLPEAIAVARALASSS